MGGHIPTHVYLHTYVYAFTSQPIPNRLGASSKLKKKSGPRTYENAQVLSNHHHLLDIRLLNITPCSITLPVKYLRMASELVFNVGCRRGPMTMAGFMVTNSILCSFANCHAARSARSLESWYHICRQIMKS